MSRRGILSNKLFVNVEVLFEDAWNDLTNDDQKQFLTQNMYLLDTDDLISELKDRGFNITNED
jgi:hypothetical protein